MKALIVGSGLMGVTSAYALARRGWEVTVIERRAGPGRETSFANGALLTPSMPEPWNAPGSWRVLLKSMGRSDSPLQLRLKALPGLWGWGARFLRNSSARRHERNTLKNLTLALHSLQALAALRRETGIEYGQATAGTLRVFRTPVSFKRAIEVAQRLRAAGLNFRGLTGQEAVSFEPALAPIVRQLAGAIHYPDDETGDAYKFCLALAERARSCGVGFQFDTAITAIDVASGRVTALRSGERRLVADRYIVAAGSYTPRLLAPIGIDVPVRPAKGYSITFEGPMSEPALRIPVVDDDFHAVVVPLQSRLRVAGTAEFAGYDLNLRRERLRNLFTLLGQVLPQTRLDPATARPWCGLRPMSVDGVPIIGPTSIGNLWVNTGHGHLGWTMAAGSARLLADLMTAAPAGVDACAYGLERFAGS